MVLGIRLTKWQTRVPETLAWQLAELEKGVRQLSIDLERCCITDGLRPVQGDILFYGAAGWELLHAGTSSYVLTTYGSGANPAWAAAGGGGGVSDGDKGDITVSVGGTVWTIDTDVVSNAKLANMAANSLKGNNTGSPADPADLTVAQVKTLLAYTTTDIGAQPLDGDLTSLAAAAATGAMYYRSAASTWSTVTVGASLDFTTGTLSRAALTGDVTAALNSNATTIANGAVSLAKMANLAANSIIGNNTGSSAVPLALTVAQTQTMLAAWSDSTIRIVDNADATKQQAFEVSGITTATTRTIEVANADVDLTCSDAYISEEFASLISSSTASSSGVAVGDVVFIGASAGTWTHVIASLDDDHPGILRLGLPATIGAAAGLIFGPHQSGGGDLFMCTFRTPSAFTNLTIKMGQFAGATAVTTEPTDGVYLWQTAGSSTFGFKSANASTRTTGSTAALSASTWYTAFIRWNTARTQADCFLLNDSGTSIVTAALTTNLPATSVVLYGQASVSTSAASALAAALDIDKIAMRWGSRGRKLVRPTANAVQEFMRR